MAIDPPSATERPQWIAFETKQGKFGDYEVFAMAPDGSRLVNLTDSWADDVAPVWSRDGRRIAFVSFRDTIAGKSGLGPGSIYVMGLDPLTGQTRDNVMPLTGKGTNDGWPTWSLDGRQIAFHSDRSGNWDIWVINLDGVGLTELTDHPGDNRYPAWSPEGRSIAFTSDRGGDQDVWLMEADGPNQTTLAQAPDSIVGLADWSPEGQRLVLYSDRPGNKDVFVVDLTIGRWTNITNHPASDEFCTWSP